MQKPFRLGVFAHVCLLSGLSLDAGDEVKHRFLAVDSGKSRLIYVDQFQPENDWTVTVPAGPRDLRLLDADKVLVSHKQGAAEYDLRTGKQTWIISSYSGIESAIRLTNGHTLLGGNTSGGAAIYEVDSRGNEIRKRLLENVHDIHILQPLKNGNLLLTRNERRPKAVAATGLYSDEHRSFVVELAADGRVVWEAELPGPADDVDRLENGSTLCPTGDLCTIVELNKEGRIASTLAGIEAHPEVGIKWLASVEVLKNGNILATNWLGHGVGPVGPHLIEFDRSNKIVWSWADHERAQMIHNSLTLE